MLWYYDMSCSAVRSGGVSGHEPHFSAPFVRSVLPSQESSKVMILAISMIDYEH
jgi:hypothetical protein